MRIHQPELVSYTPSGVNLRVHFDDGRPSEVIEVLPPSADLDPVLQSAGDVSAVVQKYTGKDAAYVDALHFESLEDILIAVRGLQEIHAA
jgi:hypothetical protein